MKQLFLSILFITAVFFTFAQSSDQVSLGKVDKIESKILDEERKIWVYVPQEGPEGLYTKQQYPVVYLLDGDGHFFSVAGMIRQLSTINGNTIVPKMIVVAIPNTNRTRDLTPTKGAAGHPFVNEAMIEASGGGEKFMSFIKEELIPHIEANYSTAPYRMLIGHSFGGLTVMNAFLKHTDVFNSYVAIDPSMWWSNQQLLKEIKNTPLDEKFKGKYLYLSIANTMDEGMELQQVLKSEDPMTEHIRSIFELDDYFKEHAAPHIKYAGKFYPKDSHGSVPLISEYDALRFFFPFYELKIGPQDVMDPKRDIVAKIKNHYLKVSEEFGYEVKPDESMLNEMGYQLMQMQMMEKAGDFFKLNTQYYPKSANVYDSLGDYYKAAGEKKEAINNYKKALTLNENPETKAKLEELQKE
jgi:predicted alpha/beta superfamily hydrolase